ncbi:hypothetical protein M9H77_13738 [Catharanthus roseus]|uniref:Uncharacterized protein n=1 Tax=Catharanthus roseus TaxID=4058 RepID=A0ACC0BLB5_CATRO|nr:hypothetical protein M9H77_13738 [Catharanthus roseus]
MDLEQQRQWRSDLGPVTDRNDRTHGRTVTTSSRGLRGSHSVSNIHTTPAPVDPSSIQPPYRRPPSSSYYPYESCSQPSSYLLPVQHHVTHPTGPVDPQLGSSFVDELLLGFQDVSPYSSHHMDYFRSSGHHGRDDGCKETVQAGGDDVDVQGDNLEDEAEHVQGKNEGEIEEDVDLGGLWDDCCGSSTFMPIC